MKTVGPVRDALLVYNNNGRSKGMGIVEFHRPGDAAVARQKYNGKTVDGRKFHLFILAPVYTELTSCTMK